MSPEFVAPLGFTPGVGALFLAIAVPVLLAADRAMAVVEVPNLLVYDWNVKLRLAYAKWRLGWRGWDGRHGLRSDILVDAVEAEAMTVAELEEIAQRVATEDVGLTETLSADGQAEVDAMKDRVAEIGETFTFTEPSRNGARAALQADTIFIPVVKLEEVDAIVRSRAEAANAFEAAYAKDDVEFATALGIFLNDNDLLLAELAVARMYRGWVPSQSGEYPIVAADKAVEAR